MKQSLTNIALIGIESRTFEGKTSYKGYFIEPIDSESGSRSFCMNLTEESVSALKSKGFNKFFKVVLAENKRIARSSGNFADYISEFSYVPV